MPYNLLHMGMYLLQKQVRVVTEQVRAIYTNRYRDRQSDLNY